MSRLPGREVVSAGPCAAKCGCILYEDQVSQQESKKVRKSLKISLFFPGRGLGFTFKLSVDLMKVCQWGLCL